MLGYYLNLHIVSFTELPCFFKTNFITQSYFDNIIFITSVLFLLLIQSNILYVRPLSFPEGVL